MTAARPTAFLLGALAFFAVLASWASPALAQDSGGEPAPPAETVEDLADPCADVPLWEKPACRVREGVQAGVGNIVSAGLTSVFDQLYEWVASGATWLLSQLTSLIDSSSRPNVSAEWFARQYRLMGSLAVALVMPLLMVSTLVAIVRQDWRGLLRSYFVYLPAAMVGTGLAIPLVDMALGITDWMSSLFLDGMRGDIEAFTGEVTDTLSAATGATAGVAGAGVAPFLMFMGAAVIALGAFAVWVELVLRAAGIYVALFFLPLGFAALVWPSTRRWFGRLVKAMAALILSKFVIVAVIALAAAALGNLGADDGSGFSGVIAGSALMLMAAFSPLVLFRLADVAGDEMASAFGGVTQHRTSPVPTPSPQQSASKMYGRIMNGRAAKDGAGMASAGAKGASAAGAAAATGGAAAASGAATAVKAPKGAAESASQRMGEVTHANGDRPERSGGGPGHTSNGHGAAAGGPSTSTSIPRREGGDHLVAATAPHQSSGSTAPGEGHVIGSTHAPDGSRPVHREQAGPRMPDQPHPHRSANPGPRPTDPPRPPRVPPPTQPPPPQ